MGLMLRKGVAELHQVFKKVGLTSEMFYSSNYTRLKRIRQLITEGRIDDSFFWSG